MVFLIKQPIIFHLVKRIKSLTIRLFVSDCTGAVYFTDLFYKGGSIATGWADHVSEIKWTLTGRVKKWQLFLQRFSETINLKRK